MLRALQSNRRSLCMHLKVHAQAAAVCAPLRPHRRSFSATTSLRTTLPGSHPELCPHHCTYLSTAAIATTRQLSASARATSSTSGRSSNATSNNGNGGVFVSQHYSGLSEGEIRTYLERKRLVSRVAGQELCVQYCPSEFGCKPHHNKPDNLWKIYLHRETGAFFCHRCGRKGSWFDFKRQLGDLRSHPVERGPRPPSSSAPPNSVASPSSSLSSSPSSPITPSSSQMPQQDQPQVQRYQQTTEHSGRIPTPDQSKVLAAHARLFEPSGHAALHYLTKERGLAPDILRKYQVGVAEFAFQNQSGEWVDEMCLTFPWIKMLPSGKPICVRQKVRSLTQKAHMRLHPAGAEWGLFGWHTVPTNWNDAIVLAEGEFDAMAIHQATGLPAVSLPNGAQSLPIQVLPFLERFTKIYLWMDDDIPGQEGARKFAQKLGVNRCLLVQTRGGHTTGPKDANDALRQGADLTSMLRSAAPMPHEEIVTFDDLRADVYREIANPSQLSGVPCKTLPGVTKLLKGMRRGELTIITGQTGVGKTTLLSQLSLDYCVQGVPTLWGSFEIKNTRLAKKLITQFSAGDLGETPQQFEALGNRFGELPLYFLRFHGTTDVDHVLDAMEYAVYVHDVEHIVLDNLQFMTSGQGTGFERFEVQDRAIEKFRHFATHKNVHISLVVHPRKQDDLAPLSISSVFGTAKATQEADNVIILQRYMGLFPLLEIKKNRFDGDLGSVGLRFKKAEQAFRQLTFKEVDEVRAQVDRLQQEQRGLPFPQSVLQSLANDDQVGGEFSAPFPDVPRTAARVVPNYLSVNVPGMTPHPAQRQAAAATDGTAKKAVTKEADGDGDAAGDDAGVDLAQAEHEEKKELEEGQEEEDEEEDDERADAALQDLLVSSRSAPPQQRRFSRGRGGGAFRKGGSFSRSSSSSGTGTGNGNDNGGRSDSKKTTDKSDPNWIPVEQREWIF
mmetsp:Transcript_2192/g.6921  ORF Transcript_2192/g.6921 Transcript_2192/m.6921 type:complete len:952 (-) Transcript_2192:1465-4320(-)